MDLSLDRRELSRRHYVLPNLRSRDAELSGTQTEEGRDQPSGYGAGAVLSLDHATWSKLPCELGERIGPTLSGLQ